MTEFLQKSIDFHGKCLMSGKFSGIIPHYEKVLPVFMEGRAMLIAGHDELLLALQGLRERALREGAVEMRGELIEGALSETRRSRISVDWHYYSEAGSLVRSSSCVYYCNPRNGRNRVEMVEYRQAAFSNTEIWAPFTMNGPRSQPTPQYLH